MGRVGKKAKGIHGSDATQLSPDEIQQITNLELQNLSQNQQNFVIVNALKTPYAIEVLTEIPSFIGSGLTPKDKQEGRGIEGMLETVASCTRSIQLGIINTVYGGVGTTVHRSPNTVAMVQVSGFAPFATVKIKGFGGQTLSTISCDASGSALWTLDGSNNIISGYDIVIPNGTANGTYIISADDGTDFTVGGANPFPAQNTVTVP